MKRVNFRSNFLKRCRQSVGVFLPNRRNGNGLVVLSDFEPFATRFEMGPLVHQKKLGVFREVFAIERRRIFHVVI